MSSIAGFSHRPILVIVRGIPGSGKSYLTDIVKKQLGSNETVVLDPDAIDFSGKDYLDISSSLTEQKVDNKLHPYRYLRSLAYSGIKEGKIIIWNQAFTNLDLLDRTIKNLESFAKEYKLNMPVIVVEVEIDPNEAKQRIAARQSKGGHGVSDSTFERFTSDYTSFNQYDYLVLSVDGHEDSTNKSAAMITQKILSLK